MPTPKPFMAFRPDPALAKAMAKLTERDGMSTSEQIRRGVRLLLKQKGLWKEKKK